MNDDEQVRYYLEEVAVYLGMLKQLDPTAIESYARVGKFIKSRYTKHGGHPDA